VLSPATPAAAAAQGEETAGYQPPVVTVPATLPPTPATYSVDASTAINRADEDPVIENLRRRLGPLSAVPTATTDHWEIAYTQSGNAVGLAFVDPKTGKVTQAWTGPQVIWPMARGYTGQFGHILNAPYVWLPLCAIFLLGLLDFRRLGRMAHLDLIALLSFGFSHIYFNRGEIGVSAPLAYIPLLYLLARMAWIGFRGRGTGLRPSVPVRWLVVAIVFLVGFRVALNLADSAVIDVGYAGVIGADRIEHGQPLYGEHAFPQDNSHGDTYGPVNYAAYVPFELVFPWSGHWDDLPAAHAATIFFDLAAIAGLFALGTRLRPGRRGRDLGIVLAFAWAAFPYTDFVMQSNSNDGLVAALLIWSLVAFSSLGWRAIMIALAAGAKFIPLFLVPLYATGYEGLAGRFTRRVPIRPESGKWERLSSLRLPRPLAIRLLYFGTVFVSVCALLLVYPAVKPGLAVAWDRTIQSQLDRTSPFSIWGQVSWLQPLQTLLMVGTLAGAAALALVPRRRNLVQVCALAAAVIIAVQLTLEHWFYLYIPWFFGMLMAASAAGADDRRRHEPEVYDQVAVAGGERPDEARAQRVDTVVVLEGDLGEQDRQQEDDVLFSEAVGAGGDRQDPEQELRREHRREDDQDREQGGHQP
jgi:hypothetical protein